MSWSSRGHAAWPPGLVPALHVPHLSPCYSEDHPSPLWGSPPMANPRGPILVASSSLRPRGWGHRGNPQHPTMERCVVGCCFAPCLRSHVFPTQNPLVLPWVLIPPGPSTSPYPIVVPKYDVTAACPVDVQVHLRDVPGGDQVLLFHFLWENRGGGAGVRDTDPNLSVLGREPWGHHGVGTAKTSFLPLGGWGWRECPPCLWNCVRACSQL